MDLHSEALLRLIYLSASDRKSSLELTRTSHEHHSAKVTWKSTGQGSKVNRSSSFSQKEEQFQFQRRTTLFAWLSLARSTNYKPELRFPWVSWRLATWWSAGPDGVFLWEKTEFEQKLKLKKFGPAPNYRTNVCFINHKKKIRKNGRNRIPLTRLSRAYLLGSRDCGPLTSQWRSAGQVNTKAKIN